MRTAFLTLLALVIAFGTIGCGDSAASSPEDVVAKAKTINESKKWGDMIDIIAPADREVAVFGMLFGAAFMTMGDEAVKTEYEALTKKHGLDKIGEETNMVDMGDEAKMKELAKKTLEGKDLKAVMQDLGDFMAKHADSFGKEEFKEVTDVKIDGSTATAMVDGKETKFKQVDGAWYLDMDS